MSTADTKVKTQTRVGVSNYEPSMWKVIFHNDDVTPMQFVTQILIEIFNKTEDESAVSYTHLTLPTTPYV